jgi:hypothetical protein
MWKIRHIKQNVSLNYNNGNLTKFALDVKVFELLVSMQNQTQALVDLKSMFSKFMAKMKDIANITPSKPKSSCKNQQKELRA